MANFGATQRIPTSSTTPSSTAENYEPKRLHQKHIKILCPFNIPSTSEAAAVRIIRNFGNFGLYYTHFVWIILFRRLFPSYRWANITSLILLVIMTYVTSLYCLLLRTWPNSTLLHTTIDKRFVLALLAITTAVELILTGDGINLAVALAISMPLVLVHAVTWAGLAFEVEDGPACSRERVPIFGHNESGASASYAV